MTTMQELPLDNRAALLSCAPVSPASFSPPLPPIIMAHSRSNKKKLCSAATLHKNSSIDASEICRPLQAVKRLRAVSPLALNENCTQHWGFDDKDAASLRARYVDEAMSSIIGPMPVKEFLAFLPETNIATMPNPENAFKLVPADAEHETDIYQPLITALNGEDGQPRCPGFTFFNTSTRGLDSGELGSMKPDICCYFNETTPFIEKNAATGLPAGDLGYADLFIEVKQSVKLDFFADPHPGHNRATHKFILDMAQFTNKNNWKKAQDALGQNVVYVTEAAGRQFREFYFSFSVAGPYARFIRWDRSGAIASEAFHLHENPEFLCEFRWRYAHASDGERGYDLTAEPASRREETLFKNAIKTQVMLQLGLEHGTLLDKAVEEHYKKHVVTAVTMFSEGPGGRRRQRLLVSRPVVAPLSMASRATRGYWAVTADRPTGKVLFLKDTWRYNVERMEKEGDILADLHSAAVPNIPRLMYHGDVPKEVPAGVAHNEGDYRDLEEEETDQHREGEASQDDETSDNEEECDTDHIGYDGDQSGEVKHGDPRNSNGKRPESMSSELSTLYQSTLTDQYLSAGWVCKGGWPDNGIAIYSHVHYRLVLGTVGYGLQHFTGSEELLRGIYDAYRAMVGALRTEDKTKRRLHKDVSLGNIILSRNRHGNLRRGFLIDWELSSLSSDTTGPRKYNKTAAFQFMSACLLGDTTAQHTFQDDMESLYIVLYCSLRWLPHNLADADLIRTIKLLFDTRSLTHDRHVSGGSNKFTNNCTGIYTSGITFPSGILAWLDKVKQHCASYHIARTTPLAELWAKPKKFKKFWRKFLQLHRLPKDDRTDRALEHAPRDGTSNAAPYPATLSAATRGIATVFPTQLPMHTTSQVHDKPQPLSKCQARDSVAGPSNITIVSATKRKAEGGPDGAKRRHESAIRVRQRGEVKPEAGRMSLREGTTGEVTESVGIFSIDFEPSRKPPLRTYTSRNKRRRQQGQ